MLFRRHERHEVEETESFEFVILIGLLSSHSPLIPFSALLKLLLLPDIMYWGSTIGVNATVYKVNTLFLYEKNN